MTRTWGELSDYDRSLILSRRRVNKHAAALYFHLVTVTQQDDDQVWAEELADAHGGGDLAKIEAMMRNRYPHTETDSWDVGTHDTSDEDDDETQH